MTKTQNVKSFSDGYQAALADIKARLVEGGAEAAAEWIANNERTDRTEKLAAEVDMDALHAEAASQAAMEGYWICGMVG